MNKQEFWETLREVPYPQEDTFVEEIVPKVLTFAFQSIMSNKIITFNGHVLDTSKIFFLEPKTPRQMQLMRIAYGDLQNNLKNDKQIFNIGN